jgi:hypothetical protein
MYKGSFSPTSLPPFVIVHFLDDSHPDWGEMESQYYLICISFMAKNVKHFFMHLLAFELGLRTLSIPLSTY